MDNSTWRGSDVILREKPWLRKNDERTEFLKLAEVVLKSEEYKLYCEYFECENPNDEITVKGFIIWKVVGGGFEKECFKK